VVTKISVAVYARSPAAATLQLNRQRRLFYLSLAQRFDDCSLSRWIGLKGGVGILPAPRWALTHPGGCGYQNLRCGFCALACRGRLATEKAETPVLPWHSPIRQYHAALCPLCICSKLNYFICMLLVICALALSQLSRPRANPEVRIRHALLSQVQRDPHLRRNCNPKCVAPPPDLHQATPEPKFVVPAQLAGIRGLGLVLNSE